MKRNNTQPFASNGHINDNTDNHFIIDHRAQTPVDIHVFTVKRLQDSEKKATKTEHLSQQVHDDLKAHATEKVSPMDSVSVLEWSLIAMVLVTIFL